MTTTSQDEPAKDAPDLESGTKHTEAKKDDRMVPLGELVELRQELRMLKEQLAQTKTGGASADTPEKPKMPQPQPAELFEAVKDLQRRERMRSLAAELGLDSEKQVAEVAKILDANPGLNPVEAKSIASVRSPDVFSEVASNGYDPAVHSSMRPRSAGAQVEPPKSDFKDRLAYVGETIKKNKSHGIRAFNNLVGSFAAKAVGRQHDLLPIPKKSS